VSVDTPKWMTALSRQATDTFAAEAEGRRQRKQLQALKKLALDAGVTERDINTATIRGI